ncbi:hypothetical protein JCM5350_005832 [Sporobolomyces pararoseus]
MSVNHPTSTVPIPLRPLNRTRRRSSSLGAIYQSSPEIDQGHFSTHQIRSDRKSTKRSRFTKNPPSPLKHSQHAVTPAYPEWSNSSPFTPLASFLPPAGSTFTSSAFDFSLPTTTTSQSPSRLPRNRTISSPSSSSSSPSSSATNSILALPPNTIPSVPLAAYQTNFTDSSFSSFNSSSSAPPSPPSVATSPPSPPTFGFLSSNPTSTLNRKLPLSEPEFSTLEAASDEDLLDGMKCDDLEIEDGGGGQIQEEAERLYHVAFEQLRRTTREDEESFVERMRRWEETEHGTNAVMTSDGRIPGKNEDEEEEGSQEADDEEDDDELEFKVDVELELKPFDLESGRRKVTEFELDDLTRRLKSGACELEDYGLVRQVQVQAQARGRIV